MKIIIVLLVLLAISMYHGIVTRQYRMQTDKLPENKSITIAHITDLHDKKYGNDQNRLISKIQKHNPDIILLTGDFIDSISHYDNSVIFMERALEIAPCYFVIGNHEYWTWSIDEVKEIVENTGVIILENSSTVVNIDGVDIEISGVSDPDVVYYVDDYEYDTWEEMLEVTYRSKQSDAYSILMSHRPEKVDSYSKYDYDLVLSGHAHGGQVRIPFLLNGLFAPNQGMFPKYAGGRYEYNDTVEIVNRGLHKKLTLPRVFNPPEIVIIEIAGETTS